MVPWDVDPEALIIEVESRTFLYAKALPDYSNKIVKNNAWESITKNLSEDWEALTNEEKNSRCKEVQAKWKHLRDNFRREYQAQKNITSGQGAKKRKKYRYYDALLFLISHVKDANTSGNYSTPTTVSDPSSPTTSNATPTTSNETPTTPNTEILAMPGPSKAPPKKKKKTTSSFEDEILKAIKNEMSETDEDKTFCLSLVPSLKKMDDDNKILAKIEILNIIRTFSNRSQNTYINQSNQSPFLGPINAPHFQPRPFHTQTTQQQHSQLPSTEARDVYQELQPGTNYMYTQTPQQDHSQSTLTQTPYMHQQLSDHSSSILHQSSSSDKSVHPSKIIQILENRQFRPAISTSQSPRSHSAQSFFTSFNPNICPSPSNTDPSSSTSITIQSPLNNITSPEDYYMSPNEC